jgi:SagB-type dehydrogenase family enzyme
VNEREAALGDLSAALEEWAAKYGVTAEFTEALSRFADNGYALAERDELRLAHLLHASLRASVTVDSAMDQESLTLVAPDLCVAEPDPTLRDAPRIALRRDPPQPLAALHELLWRRRSSPYYSPHPLPLDSLGGLLGAALGSRGMATAYHRRDVPLRTFPSAGGLQPVDTFVIANRVDGLERGVYHYDPVAHELVLRERGDFRQRVVEAVVSTGWLFHAPVVIALAGNFPRVSWKYGTRGYRYLHVDTGVAVQNLYLVAQALGLRGNAVAAFEDDAFNDLLRIDGVDRFTNLLFAAGAPVSPRARPPADEGKR